MLQFDFTNDFLKKFKKLNKKTQDKVDERLKIFSENQQSPILKCHKLYGEYFACLSINITADIRIVFKKIALNRYLLLNIGTHSQLYE